MQKIGRIILSRSGRYTIESEAQRYDLYAKGNFRIAKISPVVGDIVSFEIDDSGNASLIKEILPRKNYLIRPPMANIDTLYITVASKDPEPSLINIDKLSAIAVHYSIYPIILITKTDLDPASANKLEDIYSKAGFEVKKLSMFEPEGIKESIISSAKGKIIAFAGASGVGKSTCIDLILPELNIKTNSVSEKTNRGRHTTKECSLFPIKSGDDLIYIADTPGFSLLDFERFFFMEKEDLPYAFPEFEEYLTKCKYTKCSHTSEDGCKIIEAVKNGEIQSSRHESYIKLYSEIKILESRKYKTYNKKD